MYGKIVNIAGHSIWVWCVPSTSDKELFRRAKAKLVKYQNGEIKNLN